ncbi:MAG: hypothetical protein Q8L43_02375, partial [Deltaproteobacteria bacterium]|nr:hypothetical protein [Deltaproteobacteria bacterium]
MRARFFIGLIIAAIIGSGYAAISAGAAQEIHGYWKPPKLLKGFRGRDARKFPLQFQIPDDVSYNN